VSRARVEGIVATTSAVSSIIGSALTYRGIDINELAGHSSFEEVVYLLWYGELPSREELQRLQRELADSREIPSQVIDAIRRFPSDANAMAALRTAVSMLAFYDPLSQDMSDEANQKRREVFWRSFRP
jgi:citrate synthase